MGHPLIRGTMRLFDRWVLTQNQARRDWATVLKDWLVD
jgi:hypothetical protein